MKRRISPLLVTEIAMLSLGMAPQHTYEIHAEPSLVSPPKPKRSSFPTTPRESKYTQWALDEAEKKRARKRLKKQKENQ